MSTGNLEQHPTPQKTDVVGEALKTILIAELDRRLLASSGANSSSGPNPAVEIGTSGGGVEDIYASMFGGTSSGGYADTALPADFFASYMPETKKHFRLSRNGKIITAAGTAAALIVAGVFALPKIFGPKEQSANDVNLSTMMSATDLISKKPFAVLGYQGSGNMAASYMGNDGKTHQVTSYQGASYTAAIRQGVEYYVVPTDVKVSPLSFSQKDGRQVITVDLSKMAFDIDPTMNNGKKNIDGTEDNFVAKLYPEGAQVVTTNDTSADTANIMNALLTEPPADTKGADQTNDVDWNKLTNAQKAQRLAKSIGFYVAQSTMISLFEAGQCGDANAEAAVMTDAEKAHLTEQLQTVLKNINVDPSTVDIVFAGATKDEALARVTLNAQYSGVYSTSQNVIKANIMTMNVTDKSCTVTNVVGK